jgi:hypothetical protein
MNLFARLQTSAIWYHQCGKEHLQIAVTSVWNAKKGQEKEHHETDPKKISLFVILFRIWVSKVEACGERHQDMTSVWIDKSYYEEDADSR